MSCVYTCVICMYVSWENCGTSRLVKSYTEAICMYSFIHETTVSGYRSQFNACSTQCKNSTRQFPHMNCFIPLKEERVNSVSALCASCLNVWRLQLKRDFRVCNTVMSRLKNVNKVGYTYFQHNQLHLYDFVFETCAVCDVGQLGEFGWINFLKENT